jgi:hypothetical protein
MEKRLPKERDMMIFKVRVIRTPGAFVAFGEGEIMMLNPEVEAEMVLAFLQGFGKKILRKRDVQRELVDPKPRLFPGYSIGIAYFLMVKNT